MSPFGVRGSMSRGVISTKVKQVRSTAVPNHPLGVKAAGGFMPDKEQEDSLG